MKVSTSMQTLPLAQSTLVLSTSVILTFLPAAWNTQRSTIPFIQSYPTLWDQGGNETAWGTQWIADHLASQNRFGKPVILEEFGVTNNQLATYTAWWNEIVSSGLTGDLIW